MKHGFTLIELLVVIAIIGLLATMGAVSFVGSREKARIAGAQSFEASVHQAIGVEAVGYWSFDEGSGAVATDYSGRGNNGVLTGMVESDWVQGERGMGLDFTTSKYVNVPALSMGAFQSGLTWMGWIRTTNKTWGWMWPFSGSSNSTGFNQCGKYTGNGEVRFDLSLATPQALDTSGVDIADGKWHHLACVWDGKKKYIYIDGTLKASVVVAPTGVLASANGNFVIGSQLGLAQYWIGQLDEIRAYSVSLTATEIWGDYIAGAKRMRISRMLE